MEGCRVTDIRNGTCKDSSRKSGRLLVEDTCSRIEEIDFATFNANKPEGLK
jgi:hypothetical protein